MINKQSFDEIAGSSLNMDSDQNRNVGRTDLSGELGSVPALRETDPTPAVTRPGAGPSSAVVTR